jgi:hypothetical protein
MTLDHAITRNQPNSRTARDKLERLVEIISVATYEYQQGHVVKRRLIVTPSGGSFWIDSLVFPDVLKPSGGLVLPPQVQCLPWAIPSCASQP